MVSLRKPSITKNNSKARRRLKKYSKSVTRKDPTFRGQKVYAYIIADKTYFTAKPKQKGAKAHPLRWILWFRNTSQEYVVHIFLTDGFVGSKLFVGSEKEMRKYVSIEARAYCVKGIAVTCRGEQVYSVTNNKETQL